MRKGWARDTKAGIMPVGGQLFLREILRLHILVEISCIKQPPSPRNTWRLSIQPHP